MIGIFYVAVIVARLVSSHHAKVTRLDEEPHEGSRTEFVALKTETGPER